jgi:hypothetical protein
MRSKPKLSVCCKCNQTPQVKDMRTRFIVICECRTPFNVAFGHSVSFLDHIEDDETAQVAFDAINVNQLRESAIEAWNTNQELTNLRQQNADLVEALSQLVSAGVCFHNIGEMDNLLDSDDIGALESKFNDQLIKSDNLLSKIKG